MSVVTADALIRQLLALERHRGSNTLEPAADHTPLSAFLDAHDVFAPGALDRALEHVLAYAPHDLTQSQENYIQLVRLLLIKGADPNAALMGAYRSLGGATSQGWRAMDLAWKHSCQSMSLLFEYGGRVLSRWREFLDDRTLLNFFWWLSPMQRQTLITFNEIPVDLLLVLYCRHRYSPAARTV